MTLENSSEKQTLTLGLVIAALGVVYGDIGTSCLYGLRICFDGPGSLPATRENILGLLSLIFWSLAILISIKYLVIVLRADNNGEGGVLALMTLLTKASKHPLARTSFIVILGLFGAALMYGDGLITPVISVLSAVEGLETITPAFGRLVLPLSLLTLLFLFWFQRHGSQTIGTVFGPIMLIWFTVIGLLGLNSVIKNPDILFAVDPRHVVPFFIHNRMHGFFALGTVFLVLTGGEALYADIGHFGTRPIRAGWFSIVFPALILNYFGQGAFLLRNPSATANLFYRLAPQWALLPMVVLATMATVIASQAVISGVFSLARQSVQLGYFPRLAIIHTSNTTIGQVYVPVLNGMLCAGTIILVLAFRESAKLAGAYGVAVAMTMLITTLLLYLAMRTLWKWNILVAAGLTAVFLTMNIAFFLATLMKIKDGGWISILIAIAAFFINLTWDKGRRLLHDHIVTGALSMKDFLADVIATKPTRVSGTAVFLAGNPTGVPRTLLHNYKHNKILHKNVVILNVVTREVPFVDKSERLDVTDLGSGFFWATARFGFSESPDIPATLGSPQRGATLGSPQGGATLRSPRRGETLKAAAAGTGPDFDPMQTTFFLGRETLVLSHKHGKMLLWRKGVFSFLSRNACDASKFFHIPVNRVIEIGIQTEL
jgi:KUP system potassium uptake protein